VRERYGLDPLPEKHPFKPWIKHRRAAWDKKHPSEPEPDDDADYGTQDGRGNQ
jgi:hypothetical protein